MQDTVIFSDGTYRSACGERPMGVGMWSCARLTGSASSHIELRILMAKVPNPSRPIRCPLTASEFEAGLKAAALGPRWVEVDDPDIEPTMEPCVQDPEASRATIATIGDCNLDCCHCAIRWYARRIANLREN